MATLSIKYKGKDKKRSKTTRILVNWEQCDPKCPGWGHFESNKGNEIEACDECARFTCVIDGQTCADDSAAEAAHAKECGCDWGKYPCPKCGTNTRACSTGEWDRHCDACGTVTPLDDF